jgi:uncharacterized membrane protein YhiD involved in acid resistance
MAMKIWWRLLFVAAIALSAPAVRAAQVPPATVQPPQSSQAPQGPSNDLGETDKGEKSKKGDVLSDTPDTTTQLEQLTHALVRLPIAAILASILALRPRRRGTPRRQAPVIQTQIILAIVGAVVMLVVGSSLARAFGIVGAAGLVRYRSKIQDPKDAGVMLSTLAVGLASGVGLWMLAVFGSAFILGVLWIIESFEPKTYQLFALTIKAKDSAALKPKVEELLARHHLAFELRTATKEEVCYEVRMPLEKKTDHLSSAILLLDKANTTGVEWDEKKEKK